ncbi:MAG: TolB family protein [Lachnospiraceae bacterium]
MDAARKESVLTPDGVKEKQPVFLSDGVHMAYLSNETGEFQVFIKNLKTNEKRQITTLRHGVLRYQLSDDETKLVFEATLWPEEIQENTAFEEMTPEKKAQWEEDLDWRPYEITNLTYKLDEWHGMRKGEFSHIGTAELSSKKQKLFTSDCMEKMEAIYHPGLTMAKNCVYGYPYEGAKGFDVELFVCDETEKSEANKPRQSVVMEIMHRPLQNDTGIVAMAFVILRWKPRTAANVV